jgi:hypothetical protein
MVAGCNLILTGFNMRRPVLHCQCGCKHGRCAFWLHRHWTMDCDKVSLGRRVKRADTHWRMLAQCGNVNCMSQWKAYELGARFKSGRTSVTKLDQDTHQCCALQANISCANTFIQDDWQITVSGVATKLNVSSGSGCVTVVSISVCLWLVQELPLLFELPM